MSRVTPAQTSFNGGELSQRLRARIDQQLYAISLGSMVGFAPLVEGVAEAMPGLIHVAQALGPCRLLRFEYNTTQGHVIEASAGKFRIYTNDTLIESAPNVPVEVASPYDWAALQQLKIYQSYDVLYCFHPAFQTQQFVRLGATSFAFELVEFEDGPFEPRNSTKTLRVSASALTGAVSLEATSALFAATDVGSLLRMEAEDFGDTPAWEPGITVTAGTLRTSVERVYRAVSSGRTGGLQPVHIEGVEWDGSKEGTDINDKPAPGVQWEFVHDRFGIVKITAYADAQHVSGTVLRALPFSSVAGAGSGNYFWGGGYYNGGWGAWVPPVAAVAYQYGTWRWSFGSFSDTRGWPQCGTIWKERLCLGKDQTIHASVVGDLTSFATFNEYGEISADMAFSATINDPNVIEALIPDDRLLVLNASGTFALGPASASAGVGPKNLTLDRQNHGGCGSAAPVALDSRTLYIDRSAARIFQTDYDSYRNVEGATDLNRYARHIGAAGLIELASQQYPHNHLWALRGDATLACANYLPDEEVLGWAQRPLAEGLEARSICSITDPPGKFDQVWVAAEFGGSWHVLRMAPWRADGEHDESAVMGDMAHVFEGVAATSFSVPLLAGQAVHVVADGRFYLSLTVAGDGALVLPVAAASVVIALPFDAFMEGLPIEGGGDSGPAISKMGQIGRAWVKLLDGRGCAFGTPGQMQELAPLVDGDAEWQAERGFRHVECSGDHTREPRLRFERRAPAQATVLAWGAALEMQGK